MVLENEMDSMLVDSAKVMAKGQITLPKDIRNAMGVDTGDKVTLIYQGGQVVIINSAVYAMQYLQEHMSGKWEQANINSDEDVMEMVSKVRKEIENL